MKKFFVAAAALLFSAFAMSAQNKTFEGMFSATQNQPECTLYYPGLFGIGMIGSNAEAPFDFSTKKSIEVFYYAMYEARLYGNLYLTYGSGLGWKNFTLDNGVALAKKDDGIYSYEYTLDDSFKLSRLRIFTYSVPVLLTYDFHHHSGLSFGPVVNANISSCINTKFNDGTPKDKYKKVYERPFTLDLMADLTIQSIHFWVKYSPMNQMKKGYGWPEFQTFSFGIGL